MINGALICTMRLQDEICKGGVDIRKERRLSIVIQLLIAF